MSKTLFEKNDQLAYFVRRFMQSEDGVRINKALFLVAATYAYRVEALKAKGVHFPEHLAPTAFIMGKYGPIESLYFHANRADADYGVVCDDFPDAFDVEEEDGADFLDVIADMQGVMQECMSTSQFGLIGYTKKMLKPYNFPHQAKIPLAILAECGSRLFKDEEPHTH